MHEHGISIWFFIGIALLFIGGLILGTGLFELVYPPEFRVVMYNLHAPIWWGGLMFAAGLFYSIHFRPAVPKSTKRSADLVRSSSAR